jgi:hypothetical protein
VPGPAPATINPKSPPGNCAGFFLADHFVGITKMVKA